MLYTFNDLRDKEVVNVCDGRRLGYVCDAEIDCACGRICALLMPGPSKMFGFVRGAVIRIPWDRIERIGDDIILIKSMNIPGFDKPAEKPRKG